MPASVPDGANEEVGVVPIHAAPKVINSSGRGLGAKVVLN